MNIATVRTELDKRSIRKDNTRPVKMIVYFSGIKKRYALDLYLTDEQWGKMYGDRLRDTDLKTIKITIENAKTKAEKIVEELGVNFDFATFEKLYYDFVVVDDKKQFDVYATFDNYVKDLFSDKRIGSATSYQTAKRSFESYVSKLSFNEVTPTFLKNYEHYMIEKGSSITTIAIYIRSLRTIINLAKEKGIITHEQYPFGQKSKQKYEIPIGRNIKKALPAIDVKKIKNAKGLSKDAEFARDMWLFSFYCNGMNMTDICSLKFEDIQDGFIHYFRAKTIRTQREKKPIEVYLSETADKIIKRWGKKSINPSDYIFNVVHLEMSPEEKFWATKIFTRSVNHHMGILGEKLGFNCNLTTYVARHSYATLLKIMGTSIEEISESLGHSNVSTTKSYLDSFPKEHKKTTADKLSALI